MYLKTYIFKNEIKNGVQNELLQSKILFKTQNDTPIWIINVELIISFFTCMKANKFNYLKNTLVSPNGFLMVNFLHFVIEKTFITNSFLFELKKNPE